MTKIVFIFLISFLPNWGFTETLSGTVSGVVDGDTLSFRTSEGKRLRIRLADIDAPELDQPWGKAAKRALQIWTDGKPGSITIVDIDRYGRKIANLTVEQININKRLISEGLAWVYRDYLRDKALIPVEQAAQIRRRGLWSLKNPIPPSKWRRGERHLRYESNPTDPDQRVVKKSRSGICHAPNTTYYSRTKKFEPFKSLQDCLQSGGRMPKT